jgi:hypothetical protein
MPGRVQSLSFRGSHKGELCSGGNANRVPPKYASRAVAAKGTSLGLTALKGEMEHNDHDNDNM